MIHHWIFSFIFILMIGIASGRTYWDYYYSDTYAHHLHQYENIQAADIIILGDSVMSYQDPTDQNLDSIPQLLQKLSGDRVFDGGCSGLRVFAYPVILKKIAQYHPQPEAILLQINPVYAFHKPDNRLFHKWQAKINPSVDLWAVVQSLWEDQLIRPQKKMTTSGYALIDEHATGGLSHHQDIDFLTASIISAYEAARAITPHILFFITPIDVHKLQSPGFEEARSILFERVEIIKTIFQAYHIPFMDLHDLIDHRFYFPDRSLSHLSDEGRLILAQTLIQQIDLQLASQD